MRSLLLLFLGASFFGFGLCRDDDNAEPVENPTYKLTSGFKIPLVGYGIGNLPHESIPEVIDAQLHAGVLLIDTAYASKNERLIAEAVERFDGRRTQTRGGAGRPTVAEELMPLHVVTKVWYTHLGYERTKLSIRESLANLNAASPRQIYVHMLLHWPRCNDAIEWMDCAEEEEKLPQSVKDAGPPPHLDKGNAFKESWKAMEDMYLEHQGDVSRITHEKYHPEHQKELAKTRNEKDVTPIIASIGVSNFDLEDMKELMTSRHPPQVYQGSSWSAFYDPHLMDHIREHHIFYQSYAVISGILQNRDKCPNAYKVLAGLSRELMTTVHEEKKDNVITEATVILAYFLRKGVGVVPRAVSPMHQQANSPRALSAIQPHLTSAHLEQLERALPSLLKGEDLDISVSFMNALEFPIEIHWLHPETNEEHLVSDVIHPGQVEIHSSHVGHKFVAYDPERAIRREFVVDASNGVNQSFKIEL